MKHIAAMFREQDKEMTMAVLLDALMGLSIIFSVIVECL